MPAAHNFMDYLSTLEGEYVRTCGAPSTLVGEGKNTQWGVIHIHRVQMKRLNVTLESRLWSRGWWRTLWISTLSYVQWKWETHCYDTYTHLPTHQGGELNRQRDWKPLRLKITFFFFLPTEKNGRKKVVTLVLSRLYTGDTVSENMFLASHTHKHTHTHSYFIFSRSSLFYICPVTFQFPLSIHTFRL